MTLFQRIRSVIIGLVMLIFAFLIVIDPKEGYQTVAALLSLSLIFSGFKTLWYYFTLARHMIGGLAVLIRAVIMLDLGFFTISLQHLPRVYLLLYLLLIYAFTGVVDILNGLEARRMEAPNWKFKTFSGIIIVSLALVTLFFVRSLTVLVVVYGIGLIYSALVRIISAFR